MAAYRKLNYFQPFTSNTTCDITDFKVKSTQVKRQWDGLFVIPEAWSMRQPQDFAPNIIPTMTFPNTRTEQTPPSVEIDYGSNLVIDPTFQTPGPSPYWTFETSGGASGFISGGALTLTKFASSFGYVGVVQPISVEAGTTYIVTATARRISGTGFGQVAILASDGVSAIAYSDPYTSSADASISFYFTATEDVIVIRPQCVIAGAGTNTAVRFSSVTLQSSTYPPPPII